MLKTDYLFSGFSYIDQDIILVKVKNLVRFVINFFNLVNFVTGLTFGTGLHSSNYFLFNKKGFNATLFINIFGKTKRFYSHSSKSHSSIPGEIILRAYDGEGDPDDILPLTESCFNRDIQQYVKDFKAIILHGKDEAFRSFIFDAFN